jgi:hypothetical protein
VLAHDLLDGARDHAFDAQILLGDEHQDMKLFDFPGRCAM